jgi:bacterioferritin-associated ferredoxin
MYICICHGITDASLDSEIVSGSDSLRKIMASCGAGSDCGSCVRSIKKALGKHSQNMNHKRIDTQRSDHKA